ncbi:hypothetical protein [Tsukamurella ocularis]|uniref:hypothetical protein n=1 Tax=Tsukamurella ocularis TaxID=1970234 RepID=UPI002167F19A|nr:hypothetical protein [Tsukamurella ocularis]MCS3781711.1 hypothetical protein [Tsukamurella ocularis]MCS3788205.1 hypothetical protein [Tsukamurella ocularis]MCS3851925.1 hypothetical protein [Tsukamurella ocularis]
MSYTQHHNNVSAETAAGETREAFRYLYLVSMFREELAGLFLPVIQDVDEVWHYWILQTREYTEFCERLPGSFFIHHRSIGYSEFGAEPSREELAEQALRWVPLYVRCFGEIDETTAECWKIVKFLIDITGLTPSHIADLCGAGEMRTSVPTDGPRGQNHEPSGGEMSTGPRL